MKSNYWHNKVCVVTGASAGLGLEISKALARRQARIVVNARDEDRLLEAADQLKETGAEVLPVVGDLTCQDDVDNLAESVRQRYQQVDFLCNNAGRSTRSKILDTTPEEFQELLDVNLLATVRTTRALAEMLIQQQGHIVNIGSLASKVAPRFMGGYPASKFAVAAYSQQLRLELGPLGLHVLLVCPGPIRREADAARYNERSEGLPDEARRPGAGAKLRGIAPDWLAEKILSACERRKLELVVPGKVRALLALSQLSPRLGDWLLKRATGG